MQRNLVTLMLSKQVHQPAIFCQIVADLSGCWLCEIAAASAWRFLS
jgi:hypothetical protein